MIRDLFGKVRFNARRWWQRLIEPEVVTGGIQGCLRGRYSQATALACMYPAATLSMQMPNCLLVAGYPVGAISGTYPQAATLVSKWEC